MLKTDYAEKGFFSTKFWKAKIIEFKWFAIFFTIFLAVQIYQTSFFSWDPLVYLYQGKWFCGEQIYFEYLRPPLPGIVNCLSGTTNYSILISTILASLTYLAATIFVFIKERENEKLNQFIFTVFAFLFPSILFFANAGGDLFALSFLLIALTVKSPLKKGFFFGLATLARYNFLFYIIIILIQLKPRKWVKLFIPILLLWVPWLLFNFFGTGNLFFSLDESIFLNIQQKGIFTGIEVFHIILIVFFLITLFLNNFSKNLVNKFNLMGVLGILQFLFSGIKETRFLNILVPAQSINISKYFGSNKKIVFASIAMIFLVIAIFSITQINTQNPKTPEQQYIYDCKIMSDSWMYFYPNGIVAEPLPGRDSFEYFLDNGTNLVIYDKENYDLSNLKAEKIETQEYIILKSEKCAPQPDKFVLKIWRGNWENT